MILLQIENRVATLTLNRPEKRNALDDHMASQLFEHLEGLKNNDNCKVLIVKANGEAFCAGADLAYLQKLQKNSYEENLEDSKSLMKMFHALYTFPKISIAQVEGAAYAGGCGLATICDFVFASEKASFAYTEVKIGFIPAIVSVFLSPKIGENAARSMLLSGEVLNAHEAKNLQLINKIFDQSVINEETNDFALKLANSTSAESISLTKNLLNNLRGKGLDEQLEIASIANAEARRSKDCQIGISAFINKEKLKW